ncbi:hypothetical protein BDQ17DRAFT_1546689 [Cyathus striatus]|nr:hypothetical protein BDQ17DRAFT_1546689 [Cyathus striatus]
MIYTLTSACPSCPSLPVSPHSFKFRCWSISCFPHIWCRADMLARSQLIFYLLPILLSSVRTMGHGLPSITIDLQCSPVQNMVSGGAVLVSWTIHNFKPTEEELSLKLTTPGNHNITQKFPNATPSGKGSTTLNFTTTSPGDASGSLLFIALTENHSYFGCCSPDLDLNERCMFNPQSRMSYSSPGSTSNTQSSTNSSFPTTSSLSSTSKNTGISKGTIAGIVIAIIFILLAALLIGSLCYKTRRKRRLSQAPLLTPFNASSRTPHTAPVIPPQQWVTFNMHDNELPEYPASVVGTNTSMREDKPVMLDQRAQKDGWYQGQTTERMQQLDEERQQMKDLIEQFRERGEREWGISADALRPTTRGIPYLR